MEQLLEVAPLQVSLSGARFGPSSLTKGCGGVGNCIGDIAALLDALNLERFDPLDVPQDLKLLDPAAEPSGS